MLWERNVFPTKQRSWERRICVIRRDVTNKQHPAAKREQAERVDRGEGAGFHVHVWVSRTGNSRGPGKRGTGRDQGSLAPLSHIVDEETDSAAVSALLRGTGQVGAEQGWTGQNLSLEDTAATLMTSSMGLCADRRPRDRTLGSWLWHCQTQGDSGQVLPLPGVQLLLLYDEKTKHISLTCAWLLWPRGLQTTPLICHGISQARILEWVAIPFSRGSSQPRDQTWVSCLAGGFFTIWATREAPMIRRLD